MARQYRKILKKLQPKKSRVDKQPEKIGKDYLLIAILTLTVIFMVVGWTSFTWINRALYVALAVSLGITYARRHFKLEESTDVLVERVGYMSMACAIILFVLEIYYQFIA